MLAEWIDVIALVIWPTFLICAVASYENIRDARRAKSSRAPSRGKK